ncbi:molybdopterin converting factor subunit 1 [Neptuniibacter caesariensis]|uniref:Molybdopterin synthase sulfur carrier subunit n=1 Tax=Neptuniibacter caesariensis TaxID=207954 RepID=A0A7U8C7Z0_NEPCE|nr:molybdopterin converting factor subunit 1 [Neptuniibacter caesariensis]EAR61491.1 molybdopterin converting factor, subunit 1 [Oceanospirillum sp. MED92] [Neptuniibacter caesariensis]
MAKVVYFASLRERLGLAEETVQLDADISVSGLVDRLVEQHGETWKTVFNDSQVMVAINQEMSDQEAMVSDADEVAFFPPVTGG